MEANRETQALPQRRYWLAAGKLAAVTAALGYLFDILVSHEAVNRVGSADPGYLIAGALALHAAFGLVALRFRALLAAAQVRLSLRDSVRIHLQSLFYFFFVPMSVGMEVGRFLKIRAIRPSVSFREVFPPLVADRLLGMIGALIICVALIPTVPSAFSGRRWLIVSAFLACVALGVVAILGARRLAGRVEVLREVLQLVMARPGAMVGNIVLSVLSQVLVGLSVWLAAAGFGASVTLEGVMVALNVSTLAMVVPLSFIGVGPAEGVSVAVLSLLGLSLPVAALVTAFAYLGRLIGAVEGGVIEAVSTFTTGR